MMRRHQGAVVLADEERRFDLELAQRPTERRDDGEREVDQAGVHHRGVLALQQPNPPDLVGQRQADARDLLGEDFSGACLHFRGHGREHRGDRSGGDAFAPDVFGDFA